MSTKTENRLHIYKRPCCTPAGADPDTNRLAGLHSIVVVIPHGSNSGLVELTCHRSDLSMHLRTHVFREFQLTNCLSSFSFDQPKLASANLGRNHRLYRHVICVQAPPL